MPKKKTKKKNNLRTRTKFPALKPHLNLKTRYEEIKDMLSYANDLPEKEKAWLNSFISEYVNADFQHGGKQLHKSKKRKKSCYDKNNARNRDIFTKARATGSTVSLSSISEADETVDNVDDIVDIIDIKNNIRAWDDED